MQFVTVGVDHTTAPLAVRERFALAGPALDRALIRLRDTGSEGLILSTCNRTEYYALTGHEESGRRLLTSLLLGEAGEPVPESCLVSRAGEAAVHRLFGIASGTRSMIIGECDILRQLKIALARATELGTARSATQRLATAALAVGKRVRHTTEIGRRRPSVISVALDQARTHLAGRSDLRVLIVGAGDTAESTLEYLGRSAITTLDRVTIVGRRSDRTREIATRNGARSTPWESLAPALVDADLVVCCTSAPDHVIEPRMVLTAQRARHQAAIVFVDLAAPRDVDPMVRNIAGVTLLDLDEVARVASENAARHDAALAAAEAVILDHVARYMTWWRVRQVAPTITAFVARGDAIRDAEVQRALAQLPGLSPDQQRAVAAMAAGLTNKLLHAPLAALNRHPDAATMAVALRQLFELSPPLDHAAAAPVRDIDRHHQPLRPMAVHASFPAIDRSS